jgi:hypothetical protein
MSDEDMSGGGSGFVSNTWSPSSGSSSPKTSTANHHRNHRGDGDGLTGGGGQPSSRSHSVSRKGLHIDSSVLMCQNGCGFYGNREWSGFCSLCYKQIRHKQTPTQDKPSLISPINKWISPEMLSLRSTPRSSKSSSAASSQTSSANSSAHSTPAFTKFEEKKRQQSDKKSKTLKSIFKRAATFRETKSNSSSASSTPTSTTGSSATQALQSWTDRQLFSFDTLSLGEEVVAKFLREAAIHDIKRQINKVVDKMTKVQHKATIEEMSETIHDFCASEADPVAELGDGAAPGRGHQPPAPGGEGLSGQSDHRSDRNGLKTGAAREVRVYSELQ